MIRIKPFNRRLFHDRGFVRRCFEAFSRSKSFGHVYSIQSTYVLDPVVVYMSRIVGKIHFEGMHFRRDIGAKSLVA